MDSLVRCGTDVIDDAAILDHGFCPDEHIVHLRDDVADGAVEDAFHGDVLSFQAGLPVLPETFWPGLRHNYLKAVVLGSVQYYLFHNLAVAVGQDRLAVLDELSSKMRHSCPRRHR